jgi:hypothetical protein
MANKDRIILKINAALLVGLIIIDNSRDPISENVALTRISQITQYLPLRTAGTNGPTFSLPVAISGLIF